MNYSLNISFAQDEYVCSSRNNNRISYFPSFISLAEGLTNSKLTSDFVAGNVNIDELGELEQRSILMLHQIARGNIIIND